LYNSFEQAVFSIRPELRHMKDCCLTLGAAGALMSGSGSSIFGLFRDEQKAMAAGAALESLVGCWHVQPLT
jgi:4-diphosphocytidyl-2-C-methyl-D-erythritol kinase